MKTIFKTAIAASTAAAALSFASPATAAMQLNANGTVTITGNGGGSVVLNLGGNSGGVDYANLASSMTLNFVSAVNGTYTFNYTLQNTSSAPITSRVNAFGFDTDPNVVPQGAEILSGDVLTAIRYNTNIPNGVGNVEVCLTTLNCAGGGGTGLTNGQSASGSFSLDFGNANPSLLTLSNFAVRYQGLNVGTGSGTGQLITTAVPEPGTWALMLIGFGAVGVSMRRRRRSSALLQMA
nr:cistern family PEP-CTERM protein [uncultured Sphingomonas sp.]